MAARALWREHVERWASSGLTATQHGAQTGLEACSLMLLELERCGGSNQSRIRPVNESHGCVCAWGCELPRAHTAARPRRVRLRS
jgi:hypothetical protein